MRGLAVEAAVGSVVVAVVLSFAELVVEHFRVVDDDTVGRRSTLLMRRGLRGLM